MEFRKEIRERRKAKKRQMQLLLIKVKQSKLLDNLNSKLILNCILLIRKNSIKNKYRFINIINHFQTLPSGRTEELKTLKH